jgi:nucleotide-binding universal stress UspA family protein
VVPLDGSPFGERALPLALEVARRAAAELRIVHVHTRPAPDASPVRHYFPDGPYGMSKRGGQAYLGEVAARLARVSPVMVTPILAAGREVAAELRAVASDADLVVMATHGRGPFARLWYGSVAHDLIGHLRSPVMLVRGRTVPPPSGDAPAVRRVLIPLGGAAHAEPVLGPAAALGMLLGANYTLLRVLPLRLLAGLADPPRFGEVPPDFLPAAGSLRARGRAVETRVVFDDRPVASAILDFTRTRPADLIALTARRSGGRLRLLRGGVTDRVIRAASVPVLVCGPNGP